MAVSSLEVLIIETSVWTLWVPLSSVMCLPFVFRNLFNVALKLRYNGDPLLRVAHLAQRLAEEIGVAVTEQGAQVRLQDANDDLNVRLPTLADILLKASRPTLCAQVGMQAFAPNRLLNLLHVKLLRDVAQTAVPTLAFVLGWLLVLSKRNIRFTCVRPLRLWPFLSSLLGLRVLVH